MTKELTVVSWNTLDNLNDPQVQDAIIDTGLDVGVFAEAAPEEAGIHADTLHTFTNAGYDVYAHAYNDDDGRKDRHVLAVAVKPELTLDARAVRLAGRTAIRVLLKADDEPVDFMGLHLDDRTEQTRSNQARSLLSGLIAGGPLTLTAIAAGDLNAMHRKGVTPALLRAAKPLADILPARNPRETQSKLQRLGSIAQRVTQMADGTTMRMFAGAGFKDADPSHRPTMQQGPVKVQLDHILFRGNLTATEPTVVEPANGLSDHNRIRATLQLTDRSSL